MTKHKTVAKIILRDAQGRILVLQRSATHPRFAGHLDFPGGEVEQGEIVEDAVRREVQEETGLSLDKYTVTLLSERQVSQYKTHFVFGAQLDVENPDIVISWEHSLYEWLEPDELLSRPIPENVDSYYLDGIAHLEA